MSSSENQIICRKCKESISQDNSSCPNCGTSLRGTLPYVVGIAFGVVLVVTALLNLDSLLAYGVVGLLMAASSGYMLYEKRQRIAEAAAESQTFQG